MQKIKRTPDQLYNNKYNGLMSEFNLQTLKVGK